MKTASRLALFGVAALTLCRGQGVISTVAGNGMTTFSGDGGQATSAALSIASDMAVDSAGNIYIADRGNDRIRKVTPDGIISTFAGNGKEAFSGDGGPAASAALFLPTSVAVDSAGNVYICDSGNSRIRKVNPAGMISTVAGGGRQSGNGLLATSILLLPDTVAVDSAGNLYITDNGTNVRKVNKDGIINIVAGGAIGFSGDGGPANRAAMTFPSGVAIDAAGNLYIADKGNNRIRKVNTAGTISTYAGTGVAGFSGDGGPATSARLGMGMSATTQGVALDSAGNLYIADTQNNRIRKVNTNGIISTVVGNGTPFAGLGIGDGNAPTNASVLQPNGVTFDSAGNMYIADTNHGRIRKVAGISTGASGNPTISANGVVNGASFQPGIVANSWVTILGTNLAPKTDDWSSSVVNGKLPTALDGVSVTMGGMPAYIYFISSGQLNVLAPDLSPGPVTVVVTTAGGSASATTITASLYGPAFFAWPGSQPVATRQDFSFAAKAGTFSGATTVPAKPGEVIILWATGFGPANPLAPTGVAVPGDKTYALLPPPAVTINNTAATVFGAALAPGAAGLYQIAIQVPDSLADGDWPIRATIAGVQSPTGTILTVHR